MSKYLNKKAEVDGIVFDSQKEAKYYRYLKTLEQDGKISNLELQKRYELIPAVREVVEVERKLKTKTKVETKVRTLQKSINYVADFVYTNNETGMTEVVDVKSWITKNNPVYILKKKMMFALKGIEIQEV